MKNNLSAELRKKIIENCSGHYSPDGDGTTYYWIDGDGLRKETNIPKEAIDAIMSAVQEYVSEIIPEKDTSNIPANTYNRFQQTGYNQAIDEIKKAAENE